MGDHYALSQLTAPCTRSCGLPVASMEVDMTKLSRLTRLVRKYTPPLILLVKLISAVFDLLNKVVNYAGALSKLRVLIREPARQAGLRALATRV